MRKLTMTVAGAACLAAASVSIPTKAEARCYGCWAGAAIAAGVIGSAIIANNAYAYGGGYAPSYGYGYYGGYAPAYYGYAPAYGYAYPPAYSYSYAPAYYAPSYYNPRRYYRPYRAYIGPRVYVRSYRPYW
jgi:hypothetical protein